MLLTHCIRLAASRAACTAGKSKAIRTAMIAITTSSSIRVKARRIRRALRIDWRLLVLEREAGIKTRDQGGRGARRRVRAHARQPLRALQAALWWFARGDRPDRSVGLT